MKTVYVFLADGFEEIEALAPVDLLRRAEVNVVTVGVTGKTVTGSHGIAVVADAEGKDFVLPEDAVMVVLPGGGLGTENLGKSPMVQEVLQKAQQSGLWIAAICAAPTVLHKYGLLDKKKATVFPAMQAEMPNSLVSGNAVERDGNIITARAAGVALEFSHALITAVCSREKADAVVQSIYPVHL